MTLTNQQRVARCQQAITAYYDEDNYTNIVDFLADAMHWTHANGHSFLDAFETALLHYEAEITGDDIQDDSNHEPTKERNQPMIQSKTDQHAISKQLLRSVADEALVAFWNVVVQRYPQAETGDLSPLTTHRLSDAAENAIEEWVWANVPTTTNE